MMRRSLVPVPSPDIDLLPALWARYKDAGDVADRNRLIEHFYKLVPQAVSSYDLARFSDVDRDALLSHAQIGLIEAVEKFDPTRGVRFETYARWRIMGAIEDEERRAARDAGIPRSVRRRARLISRAAALLTAKLGRAPTIDEISAELEVPPARIRKWLQDNDEVRPDPIQANHHEQLWADRHQVPSRTALLPGTGDSPEAAFDVEELRIRLAKAIACLPDPARALLALVYREELTLEEAGNVLGIKITRVSQLQTAAITQLRALLAGPLLDKHLAGNG